MMNNNNSPNQEQSEDAKITHISTWFKVKFSALVAWKLISHLCFRGFCFLPINRRFTTGLILTNPICDSETSAYDTSEKDENNCVLKQYTMYMYRKGNSMSWGLAIQNFLDFEIGNLSKNKWYNIKELDFNVFNSNSLLKRGITWFYPPAKFISQIPHYHFPNYDDDFKRVDEDKKEKGDLKKKNTTERFMREMAETFCCTYVPEYKTGLRRKFSIAKWEADQKAYDSYRKLWNNKITIAGEEFIQYKDFIVEVIAEMKDSDRIGSAHLKQWEWSKKLSILFPVCSAVFTTLLAFLNQENEDGLFNLIPIECHGILKTAFIILSVLAALLTAWESATKDNGNEARETWLRHKHHFAKLKLETDKFLHTTSTTDSQTEENVQNQIIKYMGTINNIRKEDWSHFFSNMGFKNYDEDYFEK